jgi:CRP-like cAMP-binding protein
MLNIPLGKNLDSPISFKAGTVLFAEGEIPKYLFIIKKGNVRLLKTSGQHLLVLKNCSEKEILNEVSVLTNKPLGFTAIAKSDVELILVEQKDILSVLKKGSSWIPEILQTLCSRLDSTLEIIEEHNLMVGEKNSDMFLNKEEETKLLNALSEYKSH